MIQHSLPLVIRKLCPRTHPLNFCINFLFLLRTLKEVLSLVVSLLVLTVPDPDIQVAGRLENLSSYLGSSCWRCQLLTMGNTCSVTTRSRSLDHVSDDESNGKPKKLLSPSEPGDVWSGLRNLRIITQTVLALWFLMWGSPVWSVFVPVWEVQIEPSQSGC